VRRATVTGCSRPVGCPEKAPLVRLIGLKGLALNVEDLDLEQRRAPVRSKGGDVEFVLLGHRDCASRHVDPVDGWLS
jgi:hypothetical protein